MSLPCAGNSGTQRRDVTVILGMSEGNLDLKAWRRTKQQFPVSSGGVELGYGHQSLLSKPGESPDFPLCLFPRQDWEGSPSAVARVQQRLLDLAFIEAFERERQVNRDRATLRATQFHLARNLALDPIGEHGKSLHVAFGGRFGHGQYQQLRPGPPLFVFLKALRCETARSVTDGIARSAASVSGLAFLELIRLQVVRVTAAAFLAVLRAVLSASFTLILSLFSG